MRPRGVNPLLALFTVLHDPRMHESRDGAVYYTPKKDLNNNPETQAAAEAKRERKRQRNLVLAGLKLVLLVLLLIPVQSYAQRELTVRPVSPVPFVRDLLKPQVTPNIEWTRVDSESPYSHRSSVMFILSGNYLTMPYVNDKRNQPSMELHCVDGQLQTAYLRAHGSDYGTIKLLVRTDRKNIGFQTRMIKADLRDSIVGYAPPIGVKYTLIDIAPAVKEILKASHVGIDMVGLAVRFEMPIRPVGIDSACHIR